MDVYTTTVKTVGNVDKQQYTPITDPEDFWGITIDEVRDKISKWQSFWMVGGGNWTNPVLYRNGEAFGYFSYNLRLWDSLL